MLKYFKIAYYHLGFLFVMACTGDSNDPGPSVNCNETGPELMLTSTSTSTCTSNDGSITANVVSPEDGLMFSINGGEEQETGFFDQLTAGTYTIKVENPDGCTDSEQIAIEAESSIIDITNVVVTSNAGCKSSNGEVTISATGQGTVLYSVSPFGATSNFQASNVIGGLAAGEYIISAKDDDGCIDQSSISILNGTSYSGQVKEIILANCAIEDCHNGDDNSIPNWTIFSNVQNRAEAIKSRTQSGNMPPEDQPDLTPGQIALIACWVEDGARNN